MVLFSKDATLKKLIFLVQDRKNVKTCSRTFVYL